MSISTSLRRAAKLQEKIDELRGELSGLLDKARAEIASAPVEELPTVRRRGRPKMLKSSLTATRGGGLMPPKVDGRTKAARAARGLKPAAGRSPLAGLKRAASPSGPLAPAVVKALQTSKQPMKVRDILDRLLASGYKFNSDEPKKNLAARIYRLKGVKQVSAGLFAVA